MPISKRLPLPRQPAWIQQYKDAHRPTQESVGTDEEVTESVGTDQVAGSVGKDQVTESVGTDQVADSVVKESVVMDAGQPPENLSCYEVIH